MGVNADYHLFGCAVVQLADVLEEQTAPSSGQQQVRLVGGSSLQPQLGMFITRPSSFTIDTNKFLSTNVTIYKQAFKLSLTLNYLMCSDSPLVSSSQDVLAQ
jgi:hypothetical protein